MKRTVTTSILLIALSIGARAQIEYKQSTVSDVEFYTSNCGIFGLNVPGNIAGFIVPRGSKQTYIFGSGLWFGAKKRINDTLSKLVFVTYDPNSGRSWATPGDGYCCTIIDTESVGAPSVYHSSDYEHNTGEFNLPTLPPGKVSNWPLWLRPREQSNLSYAGEFVYTDQGRRVGSNYAAPAFVPGVDEQFVSRFHDKDLKRYRLWTTQEELRYPIGLQFQQNIYAWATGMYKHVVIVQYDVVNMSGDTLYDCSVGQATDPDIGKAVNDHLSFYTKHPELRTAFVWADHEAVPYGMLAMTLLEGPVTDASGFIDNSRRHEYLSGGRVGTLINLFNNFEPVSTEQRYDWMTSGKFDGDEGVGEYRVLLATTKFAMRPRDTAHFAVAYAVLDSVPDSAAIGTDDNRERDSLVDHLMADYYHRNDTNDLPSEPSTSVEVAPNPSQGIATVYYSITSHSNVTLKVFNTLGQIMMTESQGTLDAGSHYAKLDVTALPGGVYVIIVETELGSFATKLTVAR